MNDDQTIDEHEALRSLDRLADGELNDSARQALFEWLDSDATRWRRCALALLEARELQSALGEWMSEAPAPGRVPDSLTSHNLQSGLIGTSNRRPAIRSRRGLFAAIAAGLLVAFGLGIATDRQWSAGSLHGPDVAATIPAAQSTEAATSRNSQQDSQGTSTQERLGADAQSKPEPAKDVERPAHLVGSEFAVIPDYVRSQFERCGYRVNSQQTLISVTLPDGRQMEVPVAEWKFQYAGNRVY